MMEALERAGIKFTLTKHENAAGFMAEGVHHANGAPGILLATVGPGIANAINVIANAEQDRVPLIVLSGCIDPAVQLSFTHQVFDHKAVLSPVTKACFTAVADASDLMIDKAIRIATMERPGPVYIDIPIKIATSEHRASRGVIAQPTRSTAPAPSPQLDEVRSRLAASKRPVMIAGIDVLYEEGAARAVRQFVEHFQLPLITTYKGKGILSEDHPLSLGGHGLSPRSDEIILPLITRADLVLAVGYDPIEMRDGWANPWEPAKAIEIAAVENTHYMHHADLTYQCAIAPALAAFQHTMEARTKSWTSGELTQTRRLLSDSFEASEDWGPAAIIETARKIAPRNVIATADTGAHRILLSQMWSCYEPRTLLQSTGLCTMGCALPLAMGYKIARPEAPMLVFTGDAGLEMVLGELATLRDLRLPITIIVFVDASLALIELKQRSTGRDNLGVDFGSTDFAQIAKAMGGRGKTASGRQELEQYLTQALEYDGFTIIATPIGRRAYDGKL